MFETEHPKGTPENPLTREDVLRLRNEFLTRLREDEDAPRVLYLGEKVFENAICLRHERFCGQVTVRGETITWKTSFTKAELQRANFFKALLSRADFIEAKLCKSGFDEAALEGAWFSRANLEEATFEHANLAGAKFDEAELHRTWFSGANIRGANFWRAKLRGAYIAGGDQDITGTDLEYADWSPDFKVGHELDGHHPEPVYRRLKQWYTNHGQYDIAGEFFYREMECRRKWAGKDKKRREWAKLGFYRFLFGYGERPWRVVDWAIGSIALLSLVYALFGGLPFMNALYFSLVSFTALGYGFSLHDTRIPEWAQGMGAFESFIGVFMMALFLVTFTRKMTR